MEKSTDRSTKKKVVAVVGGGLVRKENESEMLIHCTSCLKLSLDLLNTY